MKDANGNEIPGPPTAGVIPGPNPGDPTIAGWAKQAVFGGPPQATVPLSEVPGIVAGAPGAYIGATVDAAKRDLGSGASPSRTDGNVNMVEDGVFPGTPGQMSGNEDDLDRIRTEMLMDGALMGDNAKPPPKFYQDAHEEYSGVGGKRGKELFNSAYGDGPEDGPTKLRAAVQASDAAQTQKNEAMAQFYTQESQRATEAAAARKMSMQQDQAEVAQRQARLEKAAQFYTNDLADTGKFWSNPGNILAAISFSLMPIFSNDPTVGVKLINSAIQQDLEHRRESAKMSLGALRSNLEGYRQMTGDRQSGDQLAEAEARRIAAMEVERIAAKFESPISKAKAEAIVQDLRIKANQGYMQAYSQAKIFNQASVTDPELYKRRTQGYEGAWTSMGVKDVAPIQPVGAAVNGSVGNSPSLAGSTSATAKNGGYTEHVDPAVRGILRSGAPASVAAKLAMEGRVPGSANMFNMLSTYVNRTAAAEAGGVNYGPAFEKSKAKVIGDAKKEIAAVPGLAGGPSGYAGRKASLSDLIASAEVIAASETAAGRDPDKFLGTMRTITGGAFANKYDELVRTFSKNGGSPAEIREQARRAAVDSFRQKMQMQMSQTYNDISGGAISPTELPRLQAFINDGSDFNFVRGWLHAKSKEVREKEMIATSGLTPIAKMVYMTRTGVGQRAPTLPVRPMAGPKKAPEGQGEYNAPMSKGTGKGGYSDFKSGE